MPGKLTRLWLRLALFCAGFVALVWWTPLWEAALGALFPAESQVLHPRASLLAFVWEHLQIVLASSAASALIGVTAGVLVTRRGGREFMPILDDLTALGQTFPPVAVLALAVPMLGFGFWPTVFALFLYGLLPIVHNTIAGLQGLPPDVLDAARAMGMGRLRALTRVELPLALPVILAGVRTSVIINVGTAMVGAVAGAGGLGSLVIAGLFQDNPAFVLQGAVPAALLAVLLDELIGTVESAAAWQAG